MHKFAENFLPGYGALSTSLGNESGPADAIQTKEFINMKYYHNIVAYGIATEVGSGDTITLQIYEATDSDGNGSATTTHTDTYESTNATNVDLLQAEIKADQLSSGFTHAGARLTTDNGSGTEVVGLMLLAGSPRYAQATLPANS